MTSHDELVFVPLGGLGEIGMNAALYGFGPPRSRKWILVDCGLGFASEEGLPGVDLMFPDTPLHRGRARRTSSRIFITHAHEDHIGAWPSCGRACGCRSTRRASRSASSRRAGSASRARPRSSSGRSRPGQRIAVGPFDGRVRAGRPFDPGIERARDPHARSGSSSIPATGSSTTRRIVGNTTSEAVFRRLGDEGVLALVCDSTNVVREGRSPSESEVAKRLAEIIAASPAARRGHDLRLERRPHPRRRARGRRPAAARSSRSGAPWTGSIEVARECGYLDGLPEFRPPDAYGYLPRDKVVALITGSQGEPRAALARIADDEHPEIALSKGDRVIFSSRAIPGNEKAIGRIVNMLVRQGIEVLTDRHDLVHVSGHPRRDELAAMYRWTRPRIAVPAHGEDIHLAEHAAFARAQGVPEVVRARNGTVVRLAPGQAEIVDDVPVGRLYKDGDIIIDVDRARRARAAQARLRRPRLGRDRDRPAAARSPAIR